jgi:hypothetical protein
MFLSHKVNNELIEVMDLADLFDPCKHEIIGRFHAGEELQDAEEMSKSELRFPSGEPLPQCWLNPNYREARQLQDAKVARH